MYIKVSSILVLVHINSCNILIPKKSQIEVNQAGLFNDAVIDIVPLNEFGFFANDEKKFFMQRVDVFSKSCLSSRFLCNYHFLKGSRGLNYDDLIRASTRIAQRFDDPRFFNFFYIFLQNNLDISENVLYLFANISKISYLVAYFLHTRLLKYMI